MTHEPCMCGALDCPTCGPLQGSIRCDRHGVFACDTCDDQDDFYYPEVDDGPGFEDE